MPIAIIMIRPYLFLNFFLTIFISHSAHTQTIIDSRIKKFSFSMPKHNRGYAGLFMAEKIKVFTKELIFSVDDSKDLFEPK